MPNEMSASVDCAAALPNVVRPIAPHSARAATQLWKNFVFIAVVSIAD